MVWFRDHAVLRSVRRAVCVGCHVRTNVVSELGRDVVSHGRLDSSTIVVALQQDVEHTGDVPCGTSRAEVSIRGARMRRLRLSPLHASVRRMRSPH